MKLSTDRILTTHVGSLPRPAPVADLLIRKEQGAEYDPDEFERMIAEAVVDVAARQAAIDIDIDIVSDGEMSKIGYSTYVQERSSVTLRTYRLGAGRTASICRLSSR